MISVTPRNSFAQSVTLSVSGLPSGITGSFSVNPIAVQQTSNLILKADPGAPPTTIGIHVTGSAGSLSDSETISLSVVALPSPSPVSSRSAHVYFDGFIQEVAYDPIHRLVFCANPSMNEVEVVSAATQTVVGTLAIPQAYTLAITPDGSKLWVGTVGDYLYGVDIASMQVVARATPPPIGIFPLTTVRALVATANGSLLLRMGQFNTTAEGLVQYFPATGHYKDRSKEASAERFFRSADGSKVLMATSGPVTLYDSATDSFTQSSNVNGSALAAIRNDGTQIVTLSGLQMVFLDAQLQQVASMPVTAQAGTPIYSTDGKMVYFPQDISIIRSDATFTAIDSNSLTVIGQIPDLFFMPSVINSCSVIEICDSAPGGTTLRTSEETGLLIGPSPYGLGFVDSANPRSLPSVHAGLNLNFPYYAATPSAGSPGQNANVVLNGSGFLPGDGVAFGGAPAAVVSVSTDQTMMQVIAPDLASPGPVNITASFPNTWSTLAPRAFSYGPEIQYFLPMGDAPGGGSQMILFGYGLGTDASQISVSIGGSKAQVAGSSFVAQGFNIPLYELAVTVPHGVSGPADISVTAPSGSTTLPQIFHYWQSVQSLNLGNNFTQVLYDTRRKQVYLLDPVAQAVVAISPVSGQVVLTAPTGTQPRDMTMTVDGAKLIVANYGDGTLSLINPDNPVASSVVNVGIPSNANGLLPISIATTSNGKVFISGVPNSVGASSEQVLDLATNSLTPLPNDALCGNGAVVKSMKGGAQVFSAVEGNSGGCVGIYDPVANSFIVTRELQDFLFDPAAASDGNAIVVNDQYILDASVKVEGQISIPSLIASYSPSAVYGTLIHPSGGLMYLPLTNGLHIYDLAHARLLRSYAGLTLSTSANKTMAFDDAGQTIFAISPTGLQIAQLDSVPLSIGHVDPSVAGSGGGASITVRGSGFTPSSMLLVGGTTIPHTFVDANTLSANLPSLPVGNLRVSVTNANGERFDLDDALQIQ
jgi:hypothetical protein